MTQSNIRLRTAFGMALAALIGAAAGEARAAPQIVAAAPTNGDIGLVCDGRDCAAELSTICLQQSRQTPEADVAYGLHDAHGSAIAVTGSTAAGGRLALAAGILQFTSLRGQVAFRVSVPQAVLAKLGLDGVSVRVERLAMLVPAPVAGDALPQTETDVDMAAGQARAMAGYWTVRNGGTLAVARAANRVINALPDHGAVPAAEAAALWREAADQESGLAASERARAGFVVEHCRKEALKPAGYAMRRCVAGFHDRAMQDANVDYWKAAKPQS